MLKVRFYKTGGKVSDLEIRNVLPEDENYFSKNNIIVSMEEISGEFVVYGCHKDDDSEESECIVFAQGRSCADTLHELAESCAEQYLNGIPSYE